ncbi:MAG: hypothetical protein PHI27_08440 [Eubacteriales bacterium]|nr:hypothetical protein [Eubacteriales bacterium]MDD3882266.1 hypothetical protein [Eubacteriales bacterium]MDD4512012.1 hypothetical protein [Eubacteriales bacterium]
MVIIYFYKRDFGVQKAERFFRERRVPVTLCELKKHPLGDKELSLFARCAGGAKGLIDANDSKTRESTVCYMSDEGLILDELKRAPQLLRAPIVRLGQKAAVGVNEEKWAAFAQEALKKTV